RVQQLAGPLRQPAAGRVQQRRQRPAVLDGQRDGSDAVHQELAGALPLGPVAEQRLPLLEPGVAGRHPQITHAGNPDTVLSIHQFARPASLRDTQVSVPWLAWTTTW